MLRKPRLFFLRARTCIYIAMMGKMWVLRGIFTFARVHDITAYTYMDSIVLYIREDEMEMWELVFVSSSRLGKIAVRVCLFLYIYI